jgi:hypothetical protein
MVGRFAISAGAQPGDRPPLASHPLLQPGVYEHNPEYAKVRRN